MPAKSRNCYHVWILSSRFNTFPDVCCFTNRERAIAHAVALRERLPGYNTRVARRPVCARQTMLGGHMPGDDFDACRLAFADTGCALIFPIKGGGYGG